MNNFQQYNNHVNPKDINGEQLRHDNGLVIQLQTLPECQEKGKPTFYTLEVVHAKFYPNHFIARVKQCAGDDGREQVLSRLHAFLGEG